MLLANINVSKTKEMIIDSRRYPTVSSPLLINKQATARVQQYKYLSTGIVDKLTIEPQSDGLQAKGCTFIGVFLLLTWATLYGGGFSFLSSAGMDQLLFKRR